MKFSIRELLLVTVIVAVCVAWRLDRSRLAETAADNKAKMTRAEEWGDAMQKAFTTTAVENYGLKSQVERLERENPPRQLSEMNEKTKAETMERIQRSFNSGRTYTLPGPPVLENPPEL
jgi:hypothetical protein